MSRVIRALAVFGGPPIAGIEPSEAWVTSRQAARSERSRSRSQASARSFAARLRGRRSHRPRQSRTVAIAHSTSYQRTRCFSPAACPAGAQRRLARQPRPASAPRSSPTPAGGSPAMSPTARCHRAAASVRTASLAVAIGFSDTEVARFAAHSATWSRTSHPFGALGGCSSPSGVWAVHVRRIHGRGVRRRGSWCEPGVADFDGRELEPQAGMGLRPGDAFRVHTTMPFCSGWASSARHRPCERHAGEYPHIWRVIVAAGRLSNCTRGEGLRRTGKANAGDKTDTEARPAAKAAGARGDQMAYLTQFSA